MTECTKCGADLDRKTINSYGGSTLLGFLNDAPMPGDLISPNPDSPEYTQYQGYLSCDCGRRIPISPKMILEGDFDSL